MGQTTPQSGENGFNCWGGDAFLVFRLAENAVHFAQPERDGGAISGASFPCGHADVDEIAFDMAAIRKQNATDNGGGDRSGVEIRSALEAVAGVGVEAVSASGAANGHGLEPCGFDEHVLCL